MQPARNVVRSLPLDDQAAGGRTGENPRRFSSIRRIWGFPPSSTRSQDGSAGWHGLAEVLFRTTVPPLPGRSLPDRIGARRIPCSHYSTFSWPTLHNRRQCVWGGTRAPRACTNRSPTAKINNPVGRADHGDYQLRLQAICSPSSPTTEVAGGSQPCSYPAAEFPPGDAGKPTQAAARLRQTFLSARGARACRIDGRAQFHGALGYMRDMSSEAHLQDSPGLYRLLRRTNEAEIRSGSCARTELS